MRRLAVAVGLCAPLAFAAPAPAIIGGTSTPITEAPWHVLIYEQFTDGGVQAWSFCGGSVIDATHVLTAAHCLHRDINDAGSAVVPAASVTVYAGTGHIFPGRPQQSTLDATHQERSAAGVAPDPRYDNWEFDAGVVTLASPLDLSGPAVKAIPLATTATPLGDPLTVTGWGDTSGASQSWPRDGALQRTSVHSTACDPELASHFTQGTTLCAVDPGHDICAGDSGGALVNGAGLQVGIVSGGEFCPDTTVPSWYASVADCRIRGFILSVLAPGSADPCAPPPAATVPPPGDVAPQTPAADATSPHAGFGSATCTRTRCVLTIDVLDGDDSSGIASVAVTRRSQRRVRCHVRGRPRLCTRTTYARLTATLQPDGRWRAVSHGPTNATNRFSARATDKAGNVQASATFITRHTPPLK